MAKNSDSGIKVCLAGETSRILPPRSVLEGWNVRRASTASQELSPQIEAVPNYASQETYLLQVYLSATLPLCPFVFRQGQAA